ncbi:hypothetical protein FNV43_RR00461 [Rhamnella rubrinervis]|uniref:Prefoldin subunit 5 n=1 Tax=Rhamnella rubrinervis TaxID=2594499 RepID=A0A8K0HQP3_9ROSA|nr:hypothetical protein FNV43_RR00461 [Rhamnella rubrinervis]
MASSKGEIGNPIRGGVAVAELEKLSVEQLKAVKEQTDLEVNLLQDSLNNIRTATTRLDLASTALHDLSLRPQGKKMLVPLTASLYVAGTLDDADKVLVDVGTGYFIEILLGAIRDAIIASPSGAAPTP